MTTGRAGGGTRRLLVPAISLGLFAAGIILIAGAGPAAVTALSVPDLPAGWRLDLPGAALVAGSLLAALLGLGLVSIAALRRSELARCRLQARLDRIEAQGRLAIEDRNASMAFANALVNASPDCIQLLDRDGTITFISDLGRELFEIADVEAILGRPFPEFFPQEHHSRVELALRRVQGGQTDRFTRMCPTRGGVPKWWDFIITPVHEGDGGAKRLFVVARDVSDQQAHADELGRARDAAERASVAKTQFLASMSHEIRTPLNAILGFAALARQRLDRDPELSRQIELIEKAGQSLLTIINDVLDLSKIEAGKIELELRPLVLRNLVEDCLSLTRGSAEQKGLALHCMVSAAIPARIDGDEARLRQVLLNLLNNAIKFTPAGSVTLSVELAPVSPSGQERFTICVSDTGIGIANDRIPHLFQDFVQVDGSISRHYGGTGLGLSISRRLIALMDGEIDVVSRVGEGSTFRVGLPLTEARARAEEVGELAEAVRPATEPRHILLVDDLALNLEIVGEMLAAAGHHVICADSGPSAIALYRESRPDLILMDVQMPDMDGLETTRRIRAIDEVSRRVPIVALTANVFRQQIAVYREAGMNDHLGKPFRRDDLLATVGRWTQDRDAAAPDEIAPPAEALPPIVDSRGKDELLQLLGPEKVLELQLRFRDDMSRRLQSASYDALRADAHSMASTAGMLGYARLSAAARELEQAIVADGDVALALTAVMAAKAGTMDHVRMLTAA